MLADTKKCATPVSGGRILNFEAWG
jgi:hypothetical protein